MTNDSVYQKEVLDKFSASFCGAKWLNSTIWLGSGMTTSCHHPPAHKIDLKLLKNNPSAIHNTKEKKEDRRKMQCGDRPKGCDYCWKIEDLNSNSISDRTYKSKIYSEEDLKNSFNLDYRKDSNLKTLEISFSRACNFACSYCNPAFSTTWVKDIRDNGPYKNLESDGRNHFTHTHDSAELYKKEEINPYIAAFWEWWYSICQNNIIGLRYSLEELRITGGEPLMQPEVWKIIESYKETFEKWDQQLNEKDKTHDLSPSLPNLAINTNLSLNESNLKKLINLSAYIPNFQLYTSCEAIDKQAEYIRDGLNYTQFIKNFKDIVVNSNIITLHNMCTINALCLPSLPKYLDELIDIRLNTLPLWERKDRFPSFTLNILRFPSFQSPLVLSDELRKHYSGELKLWLMRNTLDGDRIKFIHNHEIDHVNRLIEYLEKIDEPHNEGFNLEKCRRDFKRFYTQYDLRRNKNFVETFPEEMSDWYKSL